MMDQLTNICSFASAGQEGYQYARFQQNEWNCFKSVNGSQYDYECVDEFGELLLCPVGMHKYGGYIPQNAFLDVNPCAQTEEPTQEPSPHPSWSPTSNPTYGPTQVPSVHPSSIPTSHPSLIPTGFPTHDNGNYSVTKIL